MSEGPPRAPPRSWAASGALIGGVHQTRGCSKIFRKKRGTDTWGNLGIGLAGAVIGDIVVGLPKLDLGLGEIKVTLENLPAAFLGALLLLFILWTIRKSKAKKA